MMRPTNGLFAEPGVCYAPGMLEVRHLRALSAIRMGGSLARAAEELCVTQSALSHQLKDLEELIGVPLLVRKTKPVRFTAAGQRVLDLAERVLSDFEATELQLRGIAQGTAGRIHVCLECHSCFDWLMPTFERYRPRFPDVELDLKYRAPFDPWPALKDGVVDMVVTSDPFEDSAFRFLPLFRYEIRLVVAPEHRLADCEVVVPEDLGGEVLLTYPVRTERLDVYRSFLEPAGVELSERRTAELTQMLVQLAASRLGVAALPSWAIAAELRRGIVRSLRLGDAGLYATLYAAVRSAEPQRGHLDSFVELARQTSFDTLEGIERPE